MQRWLLHVEFERWRINCPGCGGVHVEWLDWLAKNPRYTGHFALQVDNLCRSMTNKAVAELERLHDSTVKSLGDALDVTAVDSHSDLLPSLAFAGGHVRDNALAAQFNTVLYQHRYADAAQHIFIGDSYPHGSDVSHHNHLHFTCNSRLALEARDQAGYRGPADDPEPVAREAQAPPGWQPPVWQPQIPGLRGGQ